MGVNAAFARVFGSDTDAILLGELSATLPTAIDGPTTGFEDVGWLHSDGVTETATGSPTQIRGHQGGKVVRTRMESNGTQIQFVALEDKALTRELRYKLTIPAATTGGVRTEKRSAGQRVAVKKCIIDFFDADDETVKERWLIDRFEITPNGDRIYVNNDIAAFPFIGEIIGEYTVLSTDLENPGTP